MLVTPIFAGFIPPCFSFFLIRLTVNLQTSRDDKVAPFYSTATTPDPLSTSFCFRRRVTALILLPPPCFPHNLIPAPGHVRVCAILPCFPPRWLSFSSRVHNSWPLTVVPRSCFPPGVLPGVTLCRRPRPSFRVLTVLLLLVRDDFARLLRLYRSPCRIQLSRCCSAPRPTLPSLCPPPRDRGRL